MGKKIKQSWSWKNGPTLDIPGRFITHSHDTNVKEFVYYENGTTDVTVTFKFGKEYDGNIPGM